MTGKSRHNDDSRADPQADPQADSGPDLGARDTIFAPASGRGPAGVAIIRVSGPGAAAALDALAGGAGPPRVAERRRLVHPQTAELLDHGLVLWFPGPASFTGEDVAEFHVHGGLAVVAAVAGALAAVPGLRLAEPGEFTRRAFENGKLDLTAAEGLADLVSAETEAQRKQALDQSGGALAALYDGWRARLMALLAHLEAGIDFAEDEVDPVAHGEIAAGLARLEAEMGSHLEDGHRGERLRDGLYVAVLGPPNAGKSTLVNALVRRQTSIVSEQAGTTRDVIEAHLDIGGYPVILADTAGLRADAEGVEGAGVALALERGRQADLKLMVLDLTAATEPATEQDGVAELVREQIDRETLVIFNKTDLVDGPRAEAEASAEKAAAGLEIGNLGFCAVSARDGGGLDVLLGKLGAAVSERLSGGPGAGSPVLTRQRHRTALEACQGALARCREACGSGAAPELVAEDLRLAVRALGRITGSVDVEDLLDIVFREFCIGK